MQNDFGNKRVLIAGKGISGTGAYEALTDAGAVCAFAEDIRNWRVFNPDWVVVSPGIDSGQPIFGFARENDVPLIGELELGFRLNEKPVIAVTGTNGKTTVTQLIGKILECAGYKIALCGNIGESFSLCASRGGYDYAVVECSSFQLETTDLFRPYIAVITNISPDHLDRHKTMQAYCAAKQKIAANQRVDDYLVLSQDDIPLYALEGLRPRGKTLYTSVRGKLEGAYVWQDTVYYRGEAVCKTDRIKMEGEHNLKNALSAVCVAKLLGLDNAAVVSALTEFVPDAHRLHLVARKGGKNYYNDSKGTNIMASVRAAECMVGDTCMIVGGSDKGYEYDDFFLQLPSTIVRIAAVGETAGKIEAAAYRCGFSSVKKFTVFTEAFTWAASGSEENVLLSPASASFDMFSSYAERGTLFERLVQDAGKK